jgi:23S rRNA pseudouridine1911/1915/1917 synthase
MKIIKVSKNFGIRIDKFLAMEFFSMSRGKIIKAIKEEKILVNGVKVKPSYILKESDEIKSDIHFEREELIPNKKIRLDIIYSDENIIVINKPAGIQVHPDGNEKENTVANALIAKFPEIKNVHDGTLGAFLRPGIVHRLDKDTSGILIIARNMKILEELKQLFQERKIQKKYLALVFGVPKDKKGIITKPIARAGNYRKQVIAGAKTKTKIRGAVTFYKVIRRYKDYSLLEVEPKTGRMHQIRIHLFSISHPVVGDKIYKMKNIKNPEKAERQLLHASELNFKMDGEKYSFNSKLPDDFASFVGNLDGSRIRS